MIYVNTNKHNAEVNISFNENPLHIILFTQSIKFCLKLNMNTLE